MDATWKENLEAIFIYDATQNQKKIPFTKPEEIPMIVSLTVQSTENT